MYQALKLLHEERDGERGQPECVEYKGHTNTPFLSTSLIHK